MLFSKKCKNFSTRRALKSPEQKNFSRWFFPSAPNPKKFRLPKLWIKWLSCIQWNGIYPVQPAPPPLSLQSIGIGLDLLFTGKCIYISFYYRRRMHIYSNRSFLFSCGNKFKSKQHSEKKEISMGAFQSSRIGGPGRTLFQLPLHI